LRDAQLRVLAQGHATLTQQMAELIVQQREAKELDRKMAEQLDENTRVTVEIRDALVAAKFVARLIKWAGGIAAGIAGIVGLWHVITGNATGKG
ncbi:MAG: hypothetical protein ACRC1H_05050, partial [Caldilineaceae bacterium]